MNDDLPEVNILNEEIEVNDVATIFLLMKRKSPN